jgi:hypothetical protein
MHCGWCENEAELVAARAQLSQARQPLTEDAIIDLWAGVSTGDDDEIKIIDLARAIEAAHGITAAPTTKEAP